MQLVKQTSSTYHPLSHRYDHRIAAHNPRRTGEAFFAVSLVAVTLAACTSATPEEPARAELTFTFRTDPGQEAHWCQYVRLPKLRSDQQMLTGYHWKQQSMHHWALYRTTPDLPANTRVNEPFDCFVPGAARYFEGAAMTQEHDIEAAVTFGTGTGFALKSEEIMAIEAHTINPTQAPIEPKIALSLDLADPSTVPNKLGLISFYDPFIVVPPRAPASAQMRCKIPKDLTMIRRWGHMHMRGVEVDVFVDPPGAPRGTTPIASSTDWEYPPILLEPVSVPKDSYVRTVCNYHGDDQFAFQGSNKVDAEMCMFIAYYYPAVPPEEGGALFERCNDGDSYGTGANTCASLLTCVQGCPAGEAPNVHDTKVDVGPCFQKCVVDSCPAASTPFVALGRCLQQNCASECASLGGSTCTSCIASRCLEEYATCQSATCGD